MTKIEYFIKCIVIISVYCSFYLVFFSPHIKIDILKKRFWGGSLFLCGIGFLVYLIPRIMTEESALLISLIVVFYFYRDDFLYCVKRYLSMFCVVSLIASSSEFFCEIVFGFTGSGVAIYIYLCMDAIVWLIFVAMLKGKIDNKSFSVDGKVGSWLTIHYLVVVLMITNFHYVLRYEVKNETLRVTGAVLAGIGGVLIAASFLVLLYYINAKHTYENRWKTAELVNNQQVLYFHELLEKEEKTRKYRHDCRAQQIVLKKYLSEGDIDKASMYIQQMTSAFDTSIGRSEFTVGNELADIILQYYLKEVSSRTEVRVNGMLGSLENIQERDLTIIISNLLRNATEAVREITEGSSMIKIECRQTLDGSQMTIQNTVPNDYNYIKRKVGFDEIEHEGFGLVNVKETIEKYGGNVYHTRENNIYKVRVWLPSKEHSII